MAHIYSNKKTDKGVSTSSWMIPKSLGTRARLPRRPMLQKGHEINDISTFVPFRVDVVQ